MQTSIHKGTGPGNSGGRCDPFNRQHWKYLVAVKALAKLHHRAHEECFITNSVLTEVIIESGV